MIKTTIIGFGDSITYGYGVDDKITYPSRLAKFMPQFFPIIQWNIINKGVNGDTTTNALKRLNRDVLRYNPNIVVMLFGSNDSSMDDEQHVPIDVFRSNLIKLAQPILSYNNHTGLNDSKPIVIFVTPPPMVDMDLYPFNTNERLCEYSNVVKETAEKLNCPCIDFFNYLKQESGGKIEDYTQFDGIHLNKAGYDCLYDAIFSELSKLIDREGIIKDLPI